MPPTLNVATSMLTEVLETSTSTPNYTESWETDAAKQIKHLVEAPDRHLPLMVALVGLPGSGKSVSSFILANLLEEQGIEAAIMPFDGYHYPLECLKSFPDPEDAIYRRGAPFTFDPVALLRDLDRIRNGTEELIRVPAFDHAAGDPEPDKHAFDRNRHKVLICEGLYLLLDEWEEVRSMFDFKIYMDSDLDKCIERLKIRNLCIPGYTPEEIVKRCDEVDRENALLVLKTKHSADLVVKSNVIVPDKPLKHLRKPSHLNLINMSEMEIQTEGFLHEAATYTDNSDWATDFHSRARSDSFTSLTHTDSFISQSADLPPPKPAASFIGTWEPEMAERIARNVKKSTRSRPYMVALVGMPGSGKSVSSFMLANFLEEQGISTMICPHDGYHYPLEYLKSFPDADDMIYRRGAPDTFDPQALLRDLKRIRDGDEEVLKLPAFDHHRGDPEPDTHVFDRSIHQVCLCEGLYLLHNADGWEDIADLFDLNIYMNTNLETCIERVKIRNCCIPGYTPEEIAIRTEKVDRANALCVLNSRSRADVVVETVSS